MRKSLSKLNATVPSGATTLEANVSTSMLTTVELLKTLKIVGRMPTTTVTSQIILAWPATLET